MLYLNGDNVENDLVKIHTKILYEARQDARQLLKGAGGGWYMKDEEWCKYHEMKTPKTPEVNVDNRWGIDLDRIMCLLNIIVGIYKQVHKGRGT